MKSLTIEKILQPTFIKIFITMNLPKNSTIFRDASHFWLRLWLHLSVINQPLEGQARVYTYLPLEYI